MGEAFLYLPHAQYMHHLCKNLRQKQKRKDWRSSGPLATHVAGTIRAWLGESSVRSGRWGQAGQRSSSVEGRRSRGERTPPPPPSIPPDLCCEEGAEVRMGPRRRRWLGGCAAGGEQRTAGPPPGRRNQHQPAVAFVLVLPKLARRRT
jgi:hypothetical protein